MLRNAKKQMCLNGSSYIPMSSNMLSKKWKYLFFTVSVTKILKCRDPDPKLTALTKEVMQKVKQKEECYFCLQMTRAEASEEGNKRHMSLHSGA